MVLIVALQARYRPEVLIWAILNTPVFLFVLGIESAYLAVSMHVTHYPISLNSALLSKAEQ